jgi:hypothetical protein
MYFAGGGFPYTEDDLHFALGHVIVPNYNFTFQAEIDGSYLRIVPSTTFNAKITDLFDFNYSDNTTVGGVPLVKLGAMVEAGYTAPGMAGHVFQEEINIQANLEPFNIPT